jgi:hypothetical protein
MRRTLIVIFGILLSVPFVTAHATASSALQQRAPVTGPQASQDQEETPSEPCPVDRLCLYSGPYFTGTQIIAAPPDGLGCGELVQPARSIINNSNTSFSVYSDTRCFNDPRDIGPYSFNNLGILARSLYY